MLKIYLKSGVIFITKLGLYMNLDKTHESPSYLVKDFTAYKIDLVLVQSKISSLLETIGLDLDF